MALYSDGFISEVQDLIAYEANLVEVADAEGIDLEAKLRLAQSEVGAELAAAALRPGNVYWTAPGWNSTGADINTSRFTLDQVAVTQPLRLWHTFQTLAIAYRDAYNRKVNDKYLPKWSEYKELARWASNLLYQTGIGVVTRPVPRPRRPAVDWVAGTLGAMTLYVRMTWVDGSNEGAPSQETAADVPANQALRVTPPAAPAPAVGWNVYVGGASGEATRQNSQPLALGQPWMMPATGLAVGVAVGTGQEPDFYRTVPRFLQRA
ncbi:MAG: hypothetical protein HY238_04370 [Acidobacteria bacterium]|nr:hypothetical protein [Acidobacteriota bacterium]